MIRHQKPGRVRECDGTKPSQNRYNLYPPMKVSSMKRIFLATALSTALLIPAAQAAPAKFFDNLSGSWSGSGQAYVTKYGEISANCRVAITGAETKVAMNGSCGMLVFRQALGLSIRNAGGNRYVGTYTGSKTGPAKLDGNPSRRPPGDDHQMGRAGEWRPDGPDGARAHRAKFLRPDCQ